MSERLKVLAVTRKAESASFQHRILTNIEPLAEQGTDVAWAQIPADARGRGELIDRLADFDIVWLHRYLVPPLAVGAWRRAARRIVFEFDDPIMYSTHGLGLARRFKFAWLLRRCDAAVVANGYLAALAAKYCRDVAVAPMVVDLPSPDTADRRRGQTVSLLWVGSRSTMKYLSALRDVLSRVGQRRPNVVLRLVGHETFRAGAMTVDFRRWSPQEQDQALRDCDIGLCPMPDTRWTRGKSPYKVLQYMANGMCWVGSAVGENVVAAGAGEDARGLCAADDDKWVESLLRLIDDGALRARLGAHGRAYVQQRHSRQAVVGILAGVFRRVAAGAQPAGQ